jgi:SAP domain
MALNDLNARFDHVHADPGTLAHVAREAARTAAQTVVDAAGDASAEVVTVIQQFEVAAHQAGRFLNYPAPRRDEYDGMTRDELAEEAGKRDLPKSGNKPDLIARLRDSDTAPPSTAPPEA